MHRSGADADSTGPDDRRVARVELPAAASSSARSVIGQLTRLARRLPPRVDLVVVSIPTIEALTVDLLAGIAVGRRLMLAHGRQLLVRLPARPGTPGAAALLGTMSFVVTPGSSSGPSS